MYAEYKDGIYRDISGETFFINQMSGGGGWHVGTSASTSDSTNLVTAHSTQTEAEAERTKLVQLQGVYEP